MNSAFGDIAPHYDDLMSGVPYRMWVGYYLLLLAQQDVQPKRVLDVCCGTGTLCEMLTREGLVMTGFDMSERMIQEARRKARQRRMRIRYEVADARDFDLRARFDAAYSFFDSLNYITDLDGFRAAVAAVGRHLEPGGSFVFDLNTAYAFEAQMFDQSNLRPQAKVRYQWTGEWDSATRQIEVTMRFWVGDREFVEMHRQRAHSDEEVRAALDDAGFEEVRAYESYGLQPPRPKSDRVHYTALKRR